MNDEVYFPLLTFNDVDFYDFGDSNSFVYSI